MGRIDIEILYNPFIESFIHVFLNFPLEYVYWITELYMYLPSTYTPKILITIYLQTGPENDLLRQRFDIIRGKTIIYIHGALVHDVHRCSNVWKSDCKFHISVPAYYCLGDIKAVRLKLYTTLQAFLSIYHFNLLFSHCWWCELRYLCSNKICESAPIDCILVGMIKMSVYLH